MEDINKSFKQPNNYLVQFIERGVEIDANWNKPEWQNIVPLDINLHIGARSTHQPITQAKIAYDSDNLYVIFRVEDRYVRAIMRGFNVPVCQDSCVEFFFLS